MQHTSVKELGTLEVLSADQRFINDILGQSQNYFTHKDPQKRPLTLQYFLDFWNDLCGDGKLAAVQELQKDLFDPIGPQPLGNEEQVVIQISESQNGALADADEFRLVEEKKAKSPPLPEASF